MSLTGKVAIVTGGNSGIGKAIALSLAEQHANIAIDFVANPDATEEQGPRKGVSAPSIERPPRFEPHG